MKGSSFSIEIVLSECMVVLRLIIFIMISVVVSVIIVNDLFIFVFSLGYI